MILRSAQQARVGELPGLGIRTSSFEGFVLNPGGFPKGVKYLTPLCGGCGGCCVGAECSLALVQERLPVLES